MRFIIFRVWVMCIWNIIHWWVQLPLLSNILQSKHGELTYFLYFIRFTSVENILNTKSKDILTCPPPSPLHSVYHSPLYVRISYNSPTVPGICFCLAGYLTKNKINKSSFSRYFPYSFPLNKAESSHSYHLGYSHTWRPPGSKHWCLLTLSCWIGGAWCTAAMSHLFYLFILPSCSCFIRVFVIHCVGWGEVSTVLSQHLRKHYVALIPEDTVIGIPYYEES